VSDVRPSQERWLLLHGTPLTPSVWTDIAAHLQPTGAVRCPWVTPGNTSEAQLDVARRLRDDLHDVTGDVHVVGHSFGGQVALELALAMPQRVRSLTILCSRDTPFPAFAAAAQAVPGFGPADLDAVLSRWFRPADLAADGPLVRYARRCLITADRALWATALRAIASYDRSHLTPTIDVPVTLIAAELDQVSTPAAMTAMAGRLSHARLHVLPDAAHMSPFLHPEALAHMIAEGRGH
jgi:pimeloyl-ACP methyl ester carboxylesterase